MAWPLAGTGRAPSASDLREALLPALAIASLASGCLGGGSSPPAAGPASAPRRAAIDGATRERLFAEYRASLWHDTCKPGMFCPMARRHGTFWTGDLLVAELHRRNPAIPATRNLGAVMSLTVASSSSCPTRARTSSTSRPPPPMAGTSI